MPKLRKMLRSGELAWQLWKEMRQVLPDLLQAPHGSKSWLAAESHKNSFGAPFVSGLDFLGGLGAGDGGRGWLLRAGWLLHD